MAPRNDAFLFPPPSRDAKNALAPRLWPGRSAGSGQAVSRILKDNRQKWDAFFYKMFHKLVMYPPTRKKC